MLYIEAFSSDLFRSTIFLRSYLSTHLPLPSNISSFSFLFIQLTFHSSSVASSFSIILPVIFSAILLFEFSLSYVFTFRVFENFPCEPKMREKGAVRKQRSYRISVYGVVANALYAATPIEEQHARNHDEASKTRNIWTCLQAQSTALVSEIGGIRRVFSLKETVSQRRCDSENFFENPRKLAILLVQWIHPNQDTPRRDHNQRGHPFIITDFTDNTTAAVSHTSFSFLVMKWAKPIGRCCWARGWHSTTTPLPKSHATKISATTSQKKTERISLWYRRKKTPFFGYEFGKRYFSFGEGGGKGVGVISLMPSWSTTHSTRSIDKNRKKSRGEQQTEQKNLSHLFSLSAPIFL